MSNAILDALDRVCDKRHQRLMAQGKSEREAADAVVLYLDSWLQRNKEWDYGQVFGKALREGYSAS